VDEASDRFEEAWETGQRPAIEAYLTGAPEPERSVLLHELLVLELGYRRRGGETPTPAEYCHRFPDHLALIQHAFEKAGMLTGSVAAPAAAYSDAPHESALPRCGTHPGADSSAIDLPAVPGYRVLHEIARGGMGRVLAAYDLGLDRDVALKILLPGANSDRFVRESKITARLPHPGIPPVHALGTLADGSPFLAMKLIAGHTLVEEMKRADRPRLLQAFLQVCQAVGFAHSRGIIHRDLKPPNVMVGAFGEVQVMDWGLAKEVAGRKVADEPRSSEPLTVPLAGTDPNQTTDDRAAAASTDVRTEAGTVLGTPSYMAPEQARGETTDARADVFALGGILCAILTGKPPFSGKSSLQVIECAAAADLAEAHARLDGCGADAEVIALCRRCLSPNPADRPTDGRAVADELTAYLNGVQERLRAAEIAGAEANERAKAERRTRRLQMIAASLLLFVLAGGIVGTSIGLVKAKRAQEQAEFAEGEEKKRADELQKVSGFQAQMLHQVDATNAGVHLTADLRARHASALEKNKLPDAEKAARIAAFERELVMVNSTDAAVAMLDRTVLTPAVEAIGSQFADQPLVEASLRTTLGTVYQKLGRAREALALYQRAYDIRAASLGDDHLDTLASRSGIGQELGELQQLAEAERIVRATLAAYERVLGEDHKETLDTKSLLALQMNYQGKYDESEAITRDVLERRRRLLGPDHVDTLGTMNELGRFLMSCGKYADAEKVLRETVDAQRRVGDPGLAATLGNLGVVLTRQKEFAAAEPYLREALEIRRRTLGDDHPLTVSNTTNLAALIMDMDKLAEAEPLAREALAKCRRIFGDEHASTLKAMNTLGQVLFRLNRFTETKPLYREALTTGRRVLGENHPDVIIWIANMGFVLQRLGRSAEAEPYFREAIDKNRRTLGETHPYTLTMTKNLVDLLRQQGKLADAEAVLRPALESVRRVQGEDHPETLRMTRNLADMLRQRNKLADAESLIRPVLETVRRKEGEDHPETIAMLSYFGGVLRDEGKLDQAEICFQQALDANRRRFGDEHANTLTAILRMGSLRVAQGKYSEALAVLTPIEGKVLKIIPGNMGVLRNASLKGLLGKARMGLAKEAAEFELAEASLLEAQSVFAKIRGEKDIETREWTRGLADLYSAWDKAEPGKGYDAKAAAWKAKLPKEAAPPSQEKM
jgi:tetratricopeptide (TPR) repeat protein